MLVELRAALWAETLKARRARMPAVTLVGFALAPLMGALFMKILLDPTWAARFGALTTKAQFSAAHGDWPTYFGLLTAGAGRGWLHYLYLGRDLALRTRVQRPHRQGPDGAAYAAYDDCNGEAVPGRDLVCCPDHMDLLCLALPSVR